MRKKRSNRIDGIVNRAIKKEKNLIIVSLAQGFGGGENQVLLLCSALESEKFPYILAVPFESPLLYRAKKRGLRVIAIPNNPYIASGFLVNLQKKANAFLFHANDGKSHTACLIASIITGKSFILTRRVSFKRINPFTYFKRKIAKLIVCISSTVASVTLNEGISREKIRIISSSVDLCKYGTMPLKKRGKNIVTVGALTENKRQIHIIRAFAEIMDKYPEYKLLLAGEGPLKGVLKREIQSLKGNTRIKLLGQVDDIPSLLKDARIFAFSSKSEGLGTSIIEAMASGLPVLAYLVDGVKDALKDTGNYPVPDGDSKGMKNEMERLILLSELEGDEWEKISEKGKKIAHQRYCHREMARKYIKIYGRFL